MYTYKIKEILKIYDGDTITVRIDCGFDVHRIESLRFARIDTPEIRGSTRELGLISRDWLRNKLNIDVSRITIKTQKDKTGKYGRYIAEVFVDDECINDSLVLNNLAVYKEY